MKIVRISAIWCVSCIVTYPLWEELKKNHPEYEYEEYDYDADTEQVEKFEIGTIIPAIIVLKNDVEVTRIIGEKSKKEFLKLIEELEN